MSRNLETGVNVKKPSAVKEEHKLQELYKQLYLIIEELVHYNRLWAPAKKLEYIGDLISQLRKLVKFEVKND